jgi:hypothetical protein
VLERVDGDYLGRPAILEWKAPGGRHPFEVVSAGVDVDVQESPLRVGPATDLEARAADGGRIVQAQHVPHAARKEPDDPPAAPAEVVAPTRVHGDSLEAPEGGASESEPARSGHQRAQEARGERGGHGAAV